MRSLKWLGVGFSLGVFLPLLVTGGVRAQDWCVDKAKVRERLKALDTLRQLDELEQCDRKAIPGLIAALKDEDSRVRRVAALALALMSALAEDAVPALLDSLKDIDPVVRKNAADALGAIGVEAKESIPALITQLKDETYVGLAAADALKRIVTDLYDTAETLEQVLETQDSALVVMQALKKTWFEQAKYEVNLILLDIAEYLKNRP